MTTSTGPQERRTLTAKFCAPASLGLSGVWEGIRRRFPYQNTFGLSEFHARVRCLQLAWQIESRIGGAIHRPVREVVADDSFDITAGLLERHQFDELIHRHAIRGVGPFRQ